MKPGPPNRGAAHRRAGCEHNLRVSIEPETKDWTWVVVRPCPDCGFDPRAVEPDRFSDLVHANTRGWYDLLADADYAVRPAPHVWSRLEYACHVRDLHRLFADRVRLMLEQDDPSMQDWDQDSVAVSEVYGEQDPASVGTELVEQAAEVAELYSRIEDDQWERTGHLAGGQRFTVASIGRYHLHDIVHHLWDVSITPADTAAEPGPQA